MKREDWAYTIIVMIVAIIFGIMWFYNADATEPPMSIPGQAEPLDFSKSRFPIPEPEIVEVGLIFPNDLDTYIKDETERDNLIHLVNKAAIDNDLNPNILWTVLLIESSYNHCYTGTKKVKCNSCNAVGIGQIIPDGMKLKKNYNVYILEDNINCAAGLLGYALNDRKYTLKQTFNWYNSGFPNKGYGSYAVKIYNNMIDKEETK